MTDICVAHLLWKPLGIDVTRQFVASYRQCRGGKAHRLVMIFNGFSEDSELEPYESLLAGIDYEKLFITPPTQDIQAYLTAARALDSEYFCFLNSYCIFRDSEWLAKLADFTQHGIGLIGCTGSWQSMYTDYYRYWKVSLPHRPYGSMIQTEYKKLRTVVSLKKQFPPFPNPHIRTNAFLIRRRVMLKLTTEDIVEKSAAHRFESGRHSLTQQILRMNLKPIVVGRDARPYESDRWYASRTFRYEDQDNLLISDNLTRAYADADEETRDRMARAAWGKT